MKAHFRLIFSLLLLISSFPALANKPVGKVAICRGVVKAKVKGTKKILDLKKGDEIVEGTIVQTGAKSFVRIELKDKSKISLGPNGQIVVSKFPEGSAGLVNLVKGQIRSQVNKDGNDKTKLLIKTKSAAMGIRGTDVITVAALKNDGKPSGDMSTIVLEGNVKQTRVNPGVAYTSKALENTLNNKSAVSIFQGNFARTGIKSTVPQRMSPVQHNALLKAGVVDDNVSTKQAAPTKQAGSTVPPGMSAKLAANDSTEIITAALGADLIVAANETTAGPEPAKDTPPPEGFIDKETGEYCPPAGTMVDLESGNLIPPPPGATFDPNQNVYVASSNYGTVDPNTGAYNPPEGFQLTEDGFVPLDDNANNEPPPLLVTAENFGDLCMDCGVTDETFAAGDAPPPEDDGINDEESGAQCPPQCDTPPPTNNAPEVGGTTSVNFNISVQ